MHTAEVKYFSKKNGSKFFLTGTIPKFIPVPESLQEAFVKRKKSFIERSSQRQKEIKNKIRVSENSPSKIVKGKPSTGMF